MVDVVLATLSTTIQVLSRSSRYSTRHRLSLPRWVHATVRLWVSGSTLTTGGKQRSVAQWPSSWMSGMLLLLDTAKPSV